MIYLKQSTASQEIPLGYFVDTTDGDTEETGLTIANTDILLWKTGATSLANKNSGGATHISNGIYYAVLDATDTNTLGSLVVFCHVSGALTVKVDCCVLAANVYDSLIGATDFIQADIIQISSTTVSVTTAQIGTNIVEIAGDSAVATNLDGLLNSISTTVTDIKTQTDKLTFTSGTDLDVNIQKVNDVSLTGDGSATPWGPA